MNRTIKTKSKNKMQNLHDKLMEKDGNYAAWHKNPNHHIFQWLFLILVVALVGKLMVNRINQNDSYGVASRAAALPVIATHPRIFITPTLLSELQIKAAANDANWLAVKSKADAYLTYSVPAFDRYACASNQICYSYQGLGWLDAIEHLGLAYQITGNVSYANKIKEVLNSANAATAAGNLLPISADSGYPSRGAAFGLALAYDWIYPELDDATKSATYGTLNAWFDWFKVNAYEKNGGAYGNYFGGHLLGFGIAGLATDGDNPRAGEITAHMRSLFDSNLPPAFTSGGFVSGHPVESYNYGPNHFVRVLQYMLAVNTATGEDLGLTQYGKKMAKDLLYNLKPNRWQSTDEGDFPGNYTGVMPGGLPVMLSYLLDGSTEGQWMQFYYNNFAAPPAGATSVQTPAPSHRLLYYSSSRPQLDYRLTEALTHRSLGDEHVYTRTSWQDNAVWSSFAAGGSYWTGHESKKAGHIAIQRGNDYLLVNSGQWKGVSGVSGSPNAFDLSGWRTNTLFFNDLGEYMYTGGTYVGGQGVWGSNQILAHEANNDFTYTKSDFTDAFDRRQDQRNATLRSVRYFNRSFVSLGDGTFAVFDRVKALKDTYIKKLYFHYNPTNGAPQILGNITTSQVGSSKLFMKTLLPASPNIVVANDPVSSTNPATITYRTEISDSATGTDLNALNVISVTDSTVSSMDPTVKVTSASGNMVGFVMSKTAGAKVVLFSADGTPQSSVAYIASYSGSGNHLLVDIAPGTYDVFKDEVKILTGIGASSQGVLTFSATGGGSFSVTQTGTQPPPPPPPANKSHLNLSPSSFTFSAVSGSSTPSAQNSSLSNTGSAVSNWSAATNQTWCHVTPSSGSTSAGGSSNISISVDAPSNVGTFPCTITITDPNADNSPQTISVTYTVTAPPPSTQVSVLTKSVSSVTANTAIINWTTNIPSTGVVKYGTSSSNLNLTAADPTTGTSHTVNLSGLNRNTRYYYRVIATSQDGTTTATSSISNFRTKSK